MALITCKECKKQISSNAKRCPQCGAKKRNPLLFWLIVGVITYFVIVPATKQSLNNVTQPRATNPVQVAVPPAADWRVSQDQSKMDDSKMVILTKEADAPIQSWLNQTKPTLHIRCLEKKIELFMIAGTAAQPEYGQYNKNTVEIRIDDSKPYKELWGQSTDSQALYAPHPLIMAKRLSNAKRVLIRFTPFNVPQATVQFTTTGLEQLLPQVVNACK